jgi:hypothetical protein
MCIEMQLIKFCVLILSSLLWPLYSSFRPLIDIFGDARSLSFAFRHTVQIDSFLSSTLFIQDYEDIISLICFGKAIVEDIENDGAAGSLHRGGVSSCQPQCFHLNVNVNFAIHQTSQRRLGRRLASCCYKT